MSRRALTMAAVAGLFLAGAVWTGALQAGDSPDSDSKGVDSRLIPPRSSDTAAQKAAKTVRPGQRSRTLSDGWWTTLGGLVTVLVLVFLTAKVLRKSVPAAQKTLPPEVVQVLGRKALDYRHTIHLVRFGSRMLMLGTSQEGMTTLSEITDPVEIDYLAGLCKPSEPSSVAQSFNQLFQRFQNPDSNHTGPDLDTDREEEPEPDPQPDHDAKADPSPAILRLQERLQQSARSDLNGVNDFHTTEARG